MTYDDLARDLSALGRTVQTPPASTLTAAVLERVSSLPTPAPSRAAQVRRSLADAAGRWRRRLTIVLVAVLLALLATPPVRATVADWFGFAGVKVEQGPDLGDDAPPPPTVDDNASLTQAAGLVGFAPLVPAELGAPDAVEVSDDRVMVSLGWSTAEGAMRIDQFDGRLDFSIAKTSPGVEYANVGGTDALWFERPHEVVVLAEDDTPRTETARLAGHTLIWPVGDLTMRLEADVTLERAIEIAESAVPYDQ